MKRKHTSRALTKFVALATAMVGVGLAPLMAPTASAISEFSTTGERTNVSFTPWATNAGLQPDESPTASKPQSKLWWAQGSWWAVMLSKTTGNQFHIWKFDSASHRWSDTGTVVDTRQRSRIDTLSDGSSLYTVGAVENNATTSADAIKFTRYTYSGGKYVVDAGFPKTLNNGGVEAAVLAKDGSGTLWVAYTAAGTTGGTPATAVRNVRYVKSGDSGASWTSTAQGILPFPESEGLGTDDIATVVGSADGASIAWSRQEANNIEAFYVARYSSASGSWSLETVDDNQFVADDHINMSVDGDAAGRLFLVVKTGANDKVPVTGSDPLLELWVRGTGGGWTPYTVNTVSQGGTRPIVVVDKDANKLRIFYTTPESGGVIYEKTTALDSPGTFSAAKRVIDVGTDPNTNNVTTTKQNMTAGTQLLLLASDGKTGFYVENYSGGTASGGGGGGGGGGTTTTAPRVDMRHAGSVVAPSRTVTARWVGAAAKYVWKKSSIGSGSGARWRTTVRTTQQAGVSFEGTPGSTYCIQARGVSSTGLMGRYSAARCVTVPLDDRQLDKRGAWKKVTAKGAFLRTALRTTSRGATLTKTVTGSKVALVVTKLPRGGKVSVFQGKRLVKRFSLSARRAQSMQFLTIADRSRVTTARYRVVVVSRGRTVMIDGLAVSRR